MPSENNRRDSFRFFIFTCRDPKSDFRLPLVDALRHHHDTYYIWLKRRPVVAGPANTDPFTEMSLFGLLRFIGSRREDDKTNIFFNSTNTYFSGLSALLRLIAPTGVWCLDMHDDLRYHNTGLTRWQEEMKISLLRRLSHVTVHAAPALKDLFPDSYHIGNASNILPLSNEGRGNDDVLIIASFDERFDFDFLSELAGLRPETQFHLHGWTQKHDASTLARIKAIGATYANVHYCGQYQMADLPSILRRYRISIAPYRTDTLLTQYIDPLRFYHCLNAGLEVISTDIPQSRYMRDWIHVVPDAATCANTLAAIQAGALAKQPAYSPITWEQRAQRLLEILRALPRTIKIAGRH